MCENPVIGGIVNIKETTKPLSLGL